MGLLKYVGEVIQDRIARRFVLRDQTVHADPFLFYKLIMGVTNVDELLKTPKIYSAVISTNGTNWVTFHTVPDGKRWSFNAYWVQQAAGDYEAHYIRVVIGGKEVRFDLSLSNGSIEWTSILAQPFKLNEGDTIQLRFKTGTTDGNYTCGIYVEEEDAFA